MYRVDYRTYIVSAKYALDFVVFVLFWLWLFTDIVACIVNGRMWFIYPNTSVVRIYMAYLLVPRHKQRNLSKQTKTKQKQHDDVIKWKHFPRYWPFVRGIHRSPVNSPHKGQWRGALIFSLICTRINDWVNNREAGDLRRCRAHYDVIVMNWNRVYISWNVLYGHIVHAPKHDAHKFVRNF